jgi:hypothetical protein
MNASIGFFRVSGRRVGAATPSSWRDDNLTCEKATRAMSRHQRMDAEREADAFGRSAGVLST